eukprot:gene3345-6017_t
MSDRSSTSIGIQSHACMRACAQCEAAAGTVHGIPLVQLSTACALFAKDLQ